jgi:hypothetical protein
MSYPIQYTVDYVEQRNRLTTFFRMLIAIPWYIVGALYIVGAIFAAMVAWFSIVFTGTYPPALYDFVASAIRMVTRASGYMWLMTDTLPPFDGGPHDDYPVRVIVPPALAEYDRVKTLARIIFLIPVYIISAILGFVLDVVGFVAWLVIVVTGNQMRGLHDVMLMATSYQARALAYFLLVTEEFPPFAVEPAPAGAQLGGA